jgi:hypothetical protein
MTTDAALKIIKNAGPIIAVFVAGGLLGGYVAVPATLQQHSDQIRAHEQRLDLIDRRLDRITCLMEESVQDRPNTQRCALMQRTHVLFEGGNGL